MFHGVLFVNFAVDEAMRINKKLTSANERQEVTIVLLKKVGAKVGHILKAWTT